MADDKVMCREAAQDRTRRHQTTSQKDIAPQPSALSSCEGNRSAITCSSCSNYVGRTIQPRVHSYIGNTYIQEYRCKNAACDDMHDDQEPT